MLKNILIIILSIALIMLCLAFSTIILTFMLHWIGKLFFAVFSINYEWTIFHGLTLALILEVLIGCLRK